MRKLFNNSLFTFIIGAILFSFIGVVSAYTTTANNITFNPNWKKQNGDEITNVNEAINDLFLKSDNIIVHGTAKSSNYANYEEVNLGFKPKMVVAIITGNTNLRAFIKSDEHKTGYSKHGGLYKEDVDNNIIFTDNGFKWFVFHSGWGEQTLEYYVLK